MDYDIIYSKRKTISLVIKDEKLVVRAPIGTRKSRIKKIVDEHSLWIEKGMEKSRERAKKNDISLEEEKELRKLAKKILPAKTAYYANIMGLKYGRITITGAKTRFGSCSSEGNISYSFRLMKYPEAAIDYVVVHELAHLIEMNHSPRFYKIIEGILPDYKERKKLLKK
jgi:predicted metal-dependent hydrolase